MRVKSIVAAVVAFASLAAFAERDTAIYRGKLTSDLNANQHSITNLPDGFFPDETDPTVPEWAKSDLADPSTVTTAGKAADALKVKEELDKKLDKSGGTLTGGLTFEGEQFGIKFNSDKQTIGFGNGNNISQYGLLIQGKPVNYPSASGTLALTSDIPAPVSVIDPSSATTTGKAADALKVKGALAEKRDLMDRSWSAPRIKPECLPITNGQGAINTYDWSSHSIVASTETHGKFELLDANGVSAALINPDGTVFAGDRIVFNGTDLSRGLSVAELETCTLALTSDISATNPDFSNAVLAVGLNIDDETLQWLKDIGAIAGSTTGQVGIGTLLAALLAALMWLKKNKVGSFVSVGGATATVDNGVAKLDDFFTNSNSLLVSTIAAKLPYPINTDGTILDRNVNVVTSGAFVIPEEFKDLLIRYAGVPASLTFSGADESIADWGDDLPTESGDYLITVTRIAASECYIRIIELKERA